MAAVAGTDATKSSLNGDALDARYRSMARREFHHLLLMHFGFFAVLLTLWQLSTYRISPLLIPSPLTVVKSLFSQIADGTIPAAVIQSFEIYFIGYLLAAVAGVAIGALMGSNELVEHALEPYVNFLYSTPRIAFIPLVIVWFGIGTQAKLVLIFLSTVFVILIPVYTGVKQVDRTFIEVARSYGLKGRGMATKVLFPAIVPYLVSGLRLGAADAFIAMITAEMFVQARGLGFLVRLYGDSFQAGNLIAVTIILILLGVLFAGGLSRLERKWMPWNQDTYLG